MNDGRINLLIEGLDWRPEYSGGVGFVGRMDAPLILSIDTQTGNINLISLEREIFSPEVYLTFGNTTEDSSVNVASWVHDITRDDRNNSVPTDPAFSRYVIENASGLMIDGVVQMNFQAIPELINTYFPNGISVNVPEAIDDYNEEKYTFMNASGELYDDYLHLEAGVQILDGYTAAAFVRSRKGYAGNGDVGRQDAQRIVLEAIIRQAGHTVRDQGLNAPVYVYSFFSDLMLSLNSMEERRIELDANPTSSPPEVGYIRTLGVTPHALLSQIRRALTWEGVGIFASYWDTSEMQNFMTGIENGTAFSAIQITTQHVNPQATSDIHYWAPARALVAETIGFDVPQSLIVETLRATITPTPALDTIRWTNYSGFEEFFENAYLHAPISGEGARFIIRYGRANDITMDVEQYIPIDILNSGYALWRLAFPQDDINDRSTTYAQPIMDIAYANSTDPLLTVWHTYWNDTFGNEAEAYTQDLLLNVADPQEPLTFDERHTTEQDFLAWLSRRG